MSPETFNPIPKSGVVEFDFSCNPRPAADDLVLTDDKVVSILANKLCLLQPDAAVELAAATSSSSSSKSASQRSSKGRNTVVEVAPERAPLTPATCAAKLKIWASRAKR